MRKNVIVPHKLVEGQSLDNSWTSPPVNVQFLDNVGFSIVTSDVSSNTGLFSVEATIDEVYWETLPVSPTIEPLASADASYLVALQQVPFRAVRVAFTGSGDGTVDIYVTAKEL